MMKVLNLTNFLLVGTLISVIVTASAEDYPRALSQHTVEVPFELEQVHLRRGYTLSKYQDGKVTIDVTCWSDGYHTYWYSDDQGRYYYEATSSYGDAYIHNKIESVVDKVCHQ